MPAPCNLDLREKAVAAVDRGEKKSHVSKLFHISRHTLDLWLKPREQTSTVAPKAPVKKGPDPKINDLEAFRRFAENHGHRTAVVMAQRWPEPISDVTIGKALRRYRQSATTHQLHAKKNYGYRERDEAKRAAFLW